MYLPLRQVVLQQSPCHRGIEGIIEGVIEGTIEGRCEWVDVSGKNEWKRGDICALREGMSVTWS